MDLTGFGYGTVEGFSGVVKAEQFPEQRRAFLHGIC